MNALARLPRPSFAAPPRGSAAFLHLLYHVGAAGIARGMALAAAAPASPPPAWVTLAEAASYSGLSVTMLKRLAGAKRIAAIRDGAIKVRRSDLDNLDNLAELTKSSTRLADASRELRDNVARRRACTAR